MRRSRRATAASRGRREGFGGLVGVEAAIVERVLAGLPGPGADQADAVRALCALGGSARSVAAPAGSGKTACLLAVARATDAPARPVSRETVASTLDPT